MQQNKSNLFSLKKKNPKVNVVKFSQCHFNKEEMMILSCYKDKALILFKAFIFRHQDGSDPIIRH